MSKSDTNHVWRKALQCLLGQSLHRMPPWEILDHKSQYEYYTETTRENGIDKGTVLVFARRQDNGDFAGLEVVEGQLIDQVICFHPMSMTGSSERNWNVVNAIYTDIFEFVAQKVVPDMKQWALRTYNNQDG